MYRCQFCGKEISESFGYLSAKDMGRALNGEIEFSEIRATCPRCDLLNDKELQNVSRGDSPDDSSSPAAGRGSLPVS